MAERGETPAERIVPADFVERYPEADSIAEALAIAEQEPTTTPEDELPRCRECDSRQLSPRALKFESEQQTGEGAYNCQLCGGTVDAARHRHAGPRARFEWVREPCDPDERTELEPPFADLDDETLIVVALAMNRPWTGESGRSYREIAGFLPYSRTWVGDRVRTWRDGGHRDLVPEPGPSVDASADRGAVATDGGRRRRWDAYGT